MNEKIQFTRRSAFGVMGAIAVAGVASCSSPGQKPLSGEERIRDEVKHLEPTSYVKTYRVDASGKDGAFKTFADAYKEVNADKQKRLGVTGTPGAQSNPWDWRKISVAPGEYHQSAVGLPNHTALVGEGASPEATHIYWDGDDNVFASSGGTSFIKNLHFDSTSLNPDDHAMRDAGPGGDVGMGEVQRRTIVFDSVKFTSATAAALTKCTNDMKPDSGVSLTFVRCIFNGPGQPQAINLVTNASPGTATSQYHFVDCKVISGLSQHPDAGLEQTAPVPIAPVGIVDFGRGRHDQVLWMNGSWQVGMQHGALGLLVLAYQKDPTLGTAPGKATTLTYVSAPGTEKGAETIKVQGSLPARFEIPSSVTLPRECCSGQEKAFFGAKPTAEGVQVRNGKVVGTLKVSAGDWYWIPVETDGNAIATKSVSISGLSAGRISAVIMIDEKGKPSVNGNGLAAGVSQGSSSATQMLETRWYYPGQGHIWVGLHFAESAEVDATRAADAAVLKMPGSSSGSLVPASNCSVLPKGNLVPCVVVSSSLPLSMRS